jgi:hypothetical protein
MPGVATLPFTLTFPSIISRSAARRDINPTSDRNFCNRIEWLSVKLTTLSKGFSFRIAIGQQSCHEKTLLAGSKAI